MAPDNEKAVEQFIAFWAAEDNLDSLPLDQVKRFFKSSEFKSDPEGFFLDVEAENPDFEEELKTAQALTDILRSSLECELPDAVADDLGDDWNDAFEEHVLIFAKKVFGWKSADEHDGEADEGDEPDEEDEDEETGPSAEVVPAASSAPPPPTATPAAAQPAATSASPAPATTPAGQLRSLTSLLPAPPPPAAKTTNQPPPANSTTTAAPAKPSRALNTDGYRLALAMAEDIIVNAPEQLSAFCTRLGSTVGVMLYGYRECNAVLDYILERRTKTAAELEADYGKPGTPPMPVRPRQT